MKLATKFLALTLVAAFALTSCHKKNNPTPNVPPPVATIQWTRLSTLPNENISALEIINNVIYAGSTTSHKIYMSADNGVTWTASAQINGDIRIAAIALFNNKIYAGTDWDIYSTADNGKTWTDEGSLTTEITSFAVWNNNLYASSYREGILKLNTGNNQWQSFANGLTPAIDFDKTSTKVLATGTDLFAGTAYSFATFNTTQQVWMRKNYFNHISTNPNIWWSDYVIDLIFNQGSLLGQVYMEYPNEETIMRSDDLGSTWYRDTLNLKTDLSKYTMHGLLVGSTKYYSISNQDTISIGTWIQQRDKSAPAGTTWAAGEEFLSTVRSSAIRENNGILFLATDGGIYFRRI